MAFKLCSVAMIAFTHAALSGLALAEEQAYQQQQQQQQMEQEVDIASEVVAEASFEAGEEDVKTFDDSYDEPATGGDQVELEGQATPKFSGEREEAPKQKVRDYQMTEQEREMQRQKQIEAERYAAQLRTFMDDFEPSDQLTTEIEAHQTQQYMIRIDSQPTIMKTVLAVLSSEPDPIIVKIFKKGAELPVKDMRGQTEVLDVMEIIEDDDLGTYIVEFTNTGRYLQDFSFIIKQIQLNEDDHETSVALSKVSREEQRMYETLEQANTEIKAFEVEQQMQQTRINHVLHKQKMATETSLWVTIGEIVAIIGFACFNVYYIKRILDNKRTI